ncbi:uncharacterized protein F5Z01DRAFT_433426 [Emericellopsis atlantica]|uniref:Chromo domain-containing protein n=1 Tax=Emericellopsis atlantica TaxID=2614577 RepID=A0A9P7ZE37_9HYPO|nr:uncharacterized protein F5Z01DRAFT_433426 [Emericellopsis atlantica]KAG9249962.1 hypothetical protein F5Z01DRAFT_433426 [Emericellopsis atlantica]
MPEIAQRARRTSSRGSSTTSQLGQRTRLSRSASPTTASSNGNVPKQHRDASPDKPRRGSIIKAFPGHADLGVAPGNRRGSVYGPEAEVFDHDASSFSDPDLGRVKSQETLHAQETTAGPGDLDSGRKSSLPDDGQSSQSVEGLTRDANSSIPPTADPTLAMDSSVVDDRPPADQVSTTSARTWRRLHSTRTLSGTRAVRPFGKRASVRSEAGSSDEDEAPARKRQKATRSARLGRGAKPKPRPARDPRLRASKSTSKQSSDRPVVSNSQSEDAFIASYQEWSLPDATLKCVRDNGKATFQLEFSWETPCVAHAAQDSSRSSAPLLSRKARNPKTNTVAHTSREVTEDSPEESHPGKAGDVGIYSVKRMLARWKRGFYFLQWSDDTTGWEPKRNILDKEMLRDFEKTYKGFDEGIDVLNSRTWAGKCQYLLHWHGRPPSEDSWVAESLMSPDAIDRFRAGGLE